MMCLGWQPKTACNVPPVQGVCPSVAWFWLLSAGAGLLLLAGKRQITNGK